MLCALLLPAVSAANERVVRIGTGSWVPYVDEQRADSGALPRLVRAIFAAAGYQVEFVYYPWDRNLLMLEQGSLDAVLPYSCSLVRQRVAQCSDPLVRGEMVLFQRNDHPFNGSSIDALKGYKIATTLGYSYGLEFDAAQQAGRIHVRQSGKEETGFRLLQLGRVDLHPQDRAVGYAMLRKMFSPQVRANISHSPQPLSAETLHLLFRKDDARGDELLRLFNTGLRGFVASGELTRLQQALFSGSVDHWLVQP